MLWRMKKKKKEKVMLDTQERKETEQEIRKICRQSIRTQYQTPFEKQHVLRVLELRETF